LQRHKFEILVVFIIKAILSDENSVRECRSKICGRDIDSISLFRAIYSITGADPELFDGLILAFTPIDNISMIPLSGCGVATNSDVTLNLAII